MLVNIYNILRYSLATPTSVLSVCLDNNIININVSYRSFKYLLFVLSFRCFECTQSMKLQLCIPACIVCSGTLCGFRYYYIYILCSAMRKIPIGNTVFVKKYDGYLHLINSNAREISKISRLEF